MKTELLNALPDWHQELIAHPERYYLIMTDDADSLMSCRLLSSLTNGALRVGGFYDFRKGLYLCNYSDNIRKEPVFIDCSVAQDGTKCIDNHFTPIINDAAINPNRLLAAHSRYNQKFPGSTLLLIAALYEVGPLDDRQIDALLAVDSFFLGFYNDKYKHINLRWLDLLGLAAELLPRLEAKNCKYFKGVQMELRCAKKLWVESDGLLKWDRTGKLPLGTFRLVMPVAAMTGSPNDVATRADVFSCAQTKSNEIKYSILEAADNEDKEKAS